MSITGGIIRGKAVAGYNPTMQTFDGSTGYYSKTGVTTSGNAVTAVVRFSTPTFSGDTTRQIFIVRGATHGRMELDVTSSDYSSLPNRRGKLKFVVRNSSGTIICRLISIDTVLDDTERTIFVAFDGTAGTATFCIDGVDADDTSNADRTAPTTGTLDSGASSESFVGATDANPNNLFTGDIGFIGYRDAYLTNWSDFMDAHGNPKELDESTWAEWGAQPLFWHDEGIMTLNKGSAGAMTANGSISTAAATTAFMGIKNGIVGPVARGVVQPKQDTQSGFDAYVESLSPVVWYPFNDDSFATTIIDHGSAGADLTSQNSTDASAGTPMRSTRSKSLAMPAATANNWAAQAAHYTDAGGIVAALQSGITAFTVAFSFRMAANSVNDDVYLFRLGTNDTVQTGGGFRCMLDTPSSTGTVKVQATYTTGNQFPESTTTQLDDGSVHFVVARFGGTSSNLTLDGTQEASGAWSATTQTTTAPFNIGGDDAIATAPYPAWQTDCFAFWPSYLTDEQVSTLSTKYLAEIA